MEYLAVCAAALLLPTVLSPLLVTAAWNVQLVLILMIAAGVLVAWKYWIFSCNFTSADDRWWLYLPLALFACSFVISYYMETRL